MAAASFCVCVCVCVQRRVTNAAVRRDDVTPPAEPSVTAAWRNVVCGDLRCLMADRWTEKEMSLTRRHRWSRKTFGREV